MIAARIQGSASAPALMCRGPRLFQIFPTGLPIGQRGLLSDNGTPSRSAVALGCRQACLSQQVLGQQREQQVLFELSAGGVPRRLFFEYRRVVSCKPESPDQTPYSSLLLWVPVSTDCFLSELGVAAPALNEPPSAAIHCNRPFGSVPRRPELGFAR